MPGVAISALCLQFSPPMSEMNVKPDQIYVAQKYGHRVRVRTIMRSMNSYDEWICTDADNGARRHVHISEFIELDESNRPSY